MLPPLWLSGWVAIDGGDRRRLQLHCAVDGVQVTADIEVTADQVTIQPIPGGAALEIPLAAWTQLSAQVIVAAHATPPQPKEPPDDR